MARNALALMTVAIMVGMKLVVADSFAGSAADASEPPGLNASKSGKITPTLHPAGSPETMANDQARAVRHANKTVFLILMENHNWSSIEGSNDAPFINLNLLPKASYAREYYSPPGLHPSEPNYLWLEAGTNFGIRNNNPPSANHQGTALHLVALLEKAGISWRSYQEDISGTDCPLKPTSRYAPKHNPMVFFDDVTDGNDPNSANCRAHIRPLSELADDLRNNTVARYNFITPNLCNDMHDMSGCGDASSVKNGDSWLADAVPLIMSSQAYADGGVVIITWDEGAYGKDRPIGLIVLSPNAKGGGYSNTVHYTHSSTLRTVQEIFGVGPLLGDAVNATALSDLFAVYP
jgi:phosphatidylinositol-3-phosphatase